MEILAILLILGILLFVSIYSIRKYRQGVIRKDINKKNLDLIQEQVVEWCSNKYEINRFSKEDLFTPSKMKNGEIDLHGLEITVNNYSKKVPWILRKQESL